MTDHRSIKRLVVKLGSGVVTLGGSESLTIDRNTIFQLATQISKTVNSGVEVVVVSSGAVALGMEELKVTERPVQMNEIQALAATGQGLLMQLWREAFDRHNLRVGQVLLTHSDLADRQRFLNVRATLDSLITYGVIPIVNENDTVMTDEITVGDNDNLAAQVTKLVGGDVLMLLTTVDGLLDLDGNVIPKVSESDNVENLISKHGSELGRGGMESKIRSARAAGRGGISVIVANGKRTNVVTDALNGEVVGTHFENKQKGLPSRKHWIAYTLKPVGTLRIDGGACKAIISDGASLLSIGITEVQGTFSAGESVVVADINGNEIARGLVRISADEINGVMGQKGPVVIHRDDLVSWN